mmetsp:Transcript_9542/g.20123  ORF Transcript_9542/g.20123 Transcript_9542/m.20123 type:complete len:266 (+) Transcript_9542:290-1087(+)
MPFQQQRKRRARAARSTRQRDRTIMRSCHESFPIEAVNPRSERVGQRVGGHEPADKQKILERKPNKHPVEIRGRRRRGRRVLVVHHKHRDAREQNQNGAVASNCGVNELSVHERNRRVPNRVHSRHARADVARVVDKRLHVHRAQSILCRALLHRRNVPRQRDCVQRRALHARLLQHRAFLVLQQPNPFQLPQVRQPAVLNQRANRQRMRQVDPSQQRAQHKLKLLLLLLLFLLALVLLLLVLVLVLRSTLKKLRLLFFAREMSV